MKIIKISKLMLENFKCHRSLVLDFADGNCSLYGDNATGKTSVYDALTWLLFGKDSHGNGEKNIEIKPLGADGEVRDRLAVTAVEAIFSVDGEKLSLRRTLREIWVTKRGSTDPVYDGNTSEYFIDGVPVKKFAFSDKVSELVSEDTFKMLTSVSHFAEGISWQARREVLFSAAGILSDREIMATDERFIPLLESLGKLSLDDYKKKLIAEKRGLVGAKSDIPARISECEKTISEVCSLDFDAAEYELAAINIELEALERDLLALENDTAQTEKRMEIREVQLEADKLEAENRVFRSKQESPRSDVYSLKLSLSRIQTSIDQRNNLILADESYIGALTKEIDAARTRWISVNGESFAGAVCPTCGQNLPEKQLVKAQAAFNSLKATRLREIEQTANARKESLAATEDRLKKARAELGELEAEQKKIEAALDAASAESTPVYDMEGYADKKVALEARISALSVELAKLSDNTLSVRAKLKIDIEALKFKAQEKRTFLSKKSLLDYTRGRIEELREDEKNTAACLEAVEGVLYLIEEFTRYKTRFVENSINGLFRIARFRLFREQANGGLEDRCDVTFDGIPYSSLNSGAKINVGIDIISTLFRVFGVSVPLFVDNAESVTRLLSLDSQVIRLVVSEKDKEIRLNYEN